jgi:glutamine synthetase
MGAFYFAAGVLRGAALPVNLRTARKVTSSERLRPRYAAPWSVEFRRRERLARVPLAAQKEAPSSPAGLLSEDERQQFLRDGKPYRTLY